MHLTPPHSAPRRRAARRWLALPAALALACGGDGGAGGGRGDDASLAADATRAADGPACDGGPVVDDFGDTTRLARVPARVVSLNPVTTEMLFALGQERRLVGRSTWDAYPAAAQQVPSLGGAIRPNVEAVLAARPDLVVLYASGDNRAAAGQLRAASVPVVALKIDHVADFARALEVLGGATCAPDRARTVRDSVLATLERVRAVTRGLPPPSVVWPVGTTPLLVVGGVGFQHELLVAAGARNAFADQQRPAAQVSAEEVLARDPDAVLVSPTRARRDSLAASPQWRGLRATRTGRLLVYDTALVLRPSVQLGAAAVSLARLFHPSAASRLPSLPGERR